MTPAVAQTYDGGGPAPTNASQPPHVPPVGCVAYTAPTFTLPLSRAGVAVTCDPTGALRVAIVSGGGGGGGGSADQTATNATDAQATRTDNQHTLAFNYIYNGATWDRARGVGGAMNIVITNPYLTTTTNALEPPTAASGKITSTITSVSANTSTQIAPADTGRIALMIQCNAGAVVISETGATLASATFGATGQTLYLPNGAQPGYIPPLTTRTAVTAYTATAQTCVATGYLR